jgi:lambda repressor-like predicted transcriptional regulator
MSPSNRPRLSDAIELDIETAKNQMHVHYWPRLQQMQELTEDARNQYQRLRPNLAPPSPRSPQALRSLLRQYASHVFEIEATHFPDEKDLEHWLQRLSGKVIAEIVQRVVQVENAGRARYVTLDYHGLTRDDMISAVREGAEESAKHRLHSATAQRLAIIAAIDGGQSQTAQTQKKRLPSTITSLSAARKLESYLEQKGMGLTQFAIQAGTTDRTLRNFRRTGKLRRSIFDDIARAMGTTKESLLGE